MTLGRVNRHAASSPLSSSAMPEDTRSRILARLAGDDPAARSLLVRAATEHALAQPIASYVDRDSLAALARAAATDANVLLLLSAHGRPAVERQKARSTRLGETLGDLLPHDSDVRVGRVLDGARLPNAAWARGIIDAKLVNELVAPVVQQTLLAFAKKLPLPGVGEGGGAVGGALGGALRGLGGLAGGAAKLVGGISAEVEKRMQSAAKDFADNAAEGFRVALKDRLESDDGKKLLRDIILRAHAKLRDVKVADVLAEIDTLPTAEVDALVAATIAHNAPRSAIADALRAEIDAALAVDGAMTLGAWLERAKIRSQVDAVIASRADAVLRAFFASDAFASVVEVLLAE
jgi:hypothetical protein